MAKGQLIVPYVPLGLAVLTGVVELTVGDGFDGVLGVLAVVIAGLVIVRQLVALLEAADLRRALVRRNSELAESGTRQRLILTGAADGIVGLDGDGTIEFANPAALTMLERSADEIVGATLHDVVHGPTCHEPSCQLSSTLDVGGFRSGAAEEFVRASGTVFPAEFSFTPFDDRGPDEGRRTRVPRHQRTAGGGPDEGRVPLGREPRAADAAHVGARIARVCSDQASGASCPSGPVGWSTSQSTTPTDSSS